MTTDDTDVRAEVAALRAELAELSGRLDLLRDAHRDELVRNRRAAVKAARLMRRLCERHLALRLDVEAIHSAASSALAAVSATVADLAAVGVAFVCAPNATLAALAGHVVADAWDRSRN